MMYRVREEQGFRWFRGLIRTQRVGEFVESHLDFNHKAARTMFGSRIICCRYFLFLGLLGTVMTTFLLSRKADAQQFDSQWVIFRENRESSQKLAKAKDLIANKKWSTAVVLLGDLLIGRKDRRPRALNDQQPVDPGQQSTRHIQDTYFRPNTSNPSHGIKAEARRLLSQLPTQAKTAYELKFGTRARLKLSEAVHTGNFSFLKDVATRFFHTQAGYEATYLLATRYQDHGHPGSASLYFQQLQKIPTVAHQFEPMLSIRLATCWMHLGKNLQAQQTLNQLQASHGRSSFIISGKRVQLFDDNANALAWLEQTVGPQGRHHQEQRGQWTMFRGDASRNATSTGEGPLLKERWKFLLLSDPAQAKKIAQFRISNLQRNVSVLSVLSPLAVGETILVRSPEKPFNLLAVDRVTGKRVWGVLFDDESGPALSAGQSRPNLPPQATSQSQVNYLQSQLWNNATFGTFSSDGKYVFLVEGSTRPYRLKSSSSSPSPQRAQSQQAFRIMPNNRLVAIEISTEGKRKWVLGDPVTGAELPLAGAFFLGPPLPLAEQLYTIAEVEGEIRLVVLEAESGKYLWSQHLADIELLNRSSQNPYRLSNTLRRLYGISPSYADGVLVCPTSTGALVAVDLATRSILWGYKFPKKDDPALSNVAGVRARAMMLMQRRRSSLYDRVENRWADTCAIISNGRIIVTSSDFDKLRCLNLADGKLLWDTARQDGLYVGGVYDRKVIVVCRGRVRALQLADGKPAWSKGDFDLPASGSSPSGRGFRSGNKYYLPLTSAEVVTIDLDHGELIARARSATGSVPGNLISYKGNVISQGMTEIECFYQLDQINPRVAAELKRDPETLRGEVFLLQGKLTQAIDQLQRTFDITGATQTRKLLVEALLTALGRNFKRYRDKIQQLEKLIKTQDERFKYLTTISRGLKHSGEVLPVFNIYLEMIDLGHELDSLEPVTNTLSVRRQRWIQAKISELRDSANQDQVAKIDRLIGRRLQAAMQDGSVEALQRFLNFFSSHPGAEQVREQLAEQAITSHRFLEAEMLLRRLERSPDPKRANAAVVRLALLYKMANHLERSASYYRRLKSEFADKVCLDNKTGKQWFDELPQDDPIQQLFIPSKPWPTGPPKVASKSQPADSSSYSLRSVPIRGVRGPLLRDMTLQFDYNNRNLKAFDKLGNELWSLRLAPKVATRFSPSIYRSIYYAHVYDHILIVSAGKLLIAIDTLTSSKSAKARILWKKELSNSQVAASLAIRMGGVGNLGRRGATTTTVTGDAVYFQRFRTIYAVDLLTGKTSWSRRNIQDRSSLFGDDQRLFSVAPGASEALVLRSSDGTVLGNRPVPNDAQRISTIGQKVLWWDVVDKTATLKFSDPWHRRDVWKKTFTSDSKTSLFGVEKIGVMDPKGHFSLVNVADGKVLLQRDVDPEKSLKEIHVFYTPERTLLVTSRGRLNRNAVWIRFLNDPSNPVINGHVHGFDNQTGEKIWSAPVEGICLLLDQPSQLPVLVFGGMIRKITPSKSERYGALLCINKRTGKRDFDQQNLSSSLTRVRLAANREKKTLTLRTKDKLFTMTYQEPGDSPKKN